MFRLLRRALISLAGGSVLIVVLVVAYMAAAIACAMLPVGRAAVVSDAEVPLAYVCASLAHADFVFDADDPLLNGEETFPAIAAWHIRSHKHLAIGWGDMRFFREVPEWSDVGPSIAVGALLGQNPTALRVAAVNPPMDSKDCIALKLSTAARAKLVAYILQTLAPPEVASPPVRGLARYEFLYPARGTYSPFRTCNQWVSDGLAAAGLPHAWFAPLSLSIMWPLRSSDAASVGPGQR